MGTRESEDGEVSEGENLSAKGIQPRIVLALLLGGSLAGVWITYLARPVPGRLLTWSVVVTTGLLVGGLYWRLALFDKGAFDGRVDARPVRDRWRSIETVAVWGFSLSGIAYLAFALNPVRLGIGGVVLAVGIALAPLLWAGVRHPVIGDANRTRAALRSGLFLLLVGSLAGFARLETGTTALDWVARFAHVGAFSLWIGGAVWHNFVVLPTIRSRPGTGAALKSQARRFRRHLPVVIPLLLVTGAYQTDRLVGLSVSALSGSRIGHLVGVKLFVLTALTGMVIVNYSKSGS